LLALRNALGQTGHDFLAGAVQDKVVLERMPECDGALGLRVLHRGLGIEFEQSKDLVDELRRVAREDAERIPRGVA